MTIANELIKPLEYDRSFKEKNKLFLCIRSLELIIHNIKANFMILVLYIST